MIERTVRFDVVLRLIFMIALAAVGVCAQSAVAGGGNDDDDEYIQPVRPSIANPAEFQKPGVLQLDYGYDGNFRARDFRAQQAAPMTLRFAVSKRLLLSAAIDTVVSETDEMKMRSAGVGDTRLGFQVVAREHTEKSPAVAFAYYVKLPSASQSKGLGTGRIDHSLVVLISQKAGKTDVDFNAAYLNVGREDSSRRASGGQAALSVSRQFENKLGYVAEIGGQSVDDVQPRGLYALGGLTYKVNRRLQLDGGLRFGLNPAAPRVGAFTGLTVGLGNLYRNRH
jgi:Putative MetA-pathway of phenol degradation